MRALSIYAETRLLAKLPRCTRSHKDQFARRQSDQEPCLRAHMDGYETGFAEVEEDISAVIFASNTAAFRIFTSSSRF